MKILYLDDVIDLLCFACVLKHSHPDWHTFCLNLSTIFLDGQGFVSHSQTFQLYMLKKFNMDFVVCL